MTSGILWNLAANNGKGWVEAYQRGREQHFDNQARELLNPSGPSIIEQLVGGVVPGVRQPGHSVLTRVLGMPETPQAEPERFNPMNPSPEHVAVMLQSQRYAPMAQQLVAQRQNQANIDRQAARDDRRDTQQQQNWQADHTLRREQFARGNIPQGFEPDPTKPGAWRPVSGGPQDPEHIRRVNDSKPTRIPVGVQNAEKEDLEAIQSLNTVNTSLGKFDTLIKTGKLNLGLLNNYEARFRNTIGKSDESSRNFSSFSAELERLRNESLRLNKGVQTEGDSQRAWNELIANINDPEVVRQRIKEIIEINQRAVRFRQNLIAQRRDDNRLPQLSLDRIFSPQPPNQSGDIPRVNSYQEMLKLAPGTVYIASDGKQYRVPQR